MTDAEALNWLRKHGCVVIFHGDRLLAFRPTRLVNLHEANGSPMITFPHGAVFGYTEYSGETLADLVESVRECWRENHAGPVDALADCCEDSKPPAVELYIGRMLKEKYPELAEGER